MSWDPKILATAPSADDLPGMVDKLLDHQRSNWNALREGEEALKKVRSKTFTREHVDIIVQANPGRRVSTHAKVDPASIAKRPCFLCPENMPDQERGIAFGDFVVLPNPHPILGRHCTIPAREHSPQRIDERIRSLLELAGALGPDMLVFYNGPRCGASAPDHFHFQSCDATGVPLPASLPAGPEKGGVTFFSNFGRKMIVCADRRIEEARAKIARVLDVLAAGEPSGEEPLINMLSWFRDGRYTTVIFPRAKHRPDCFFAADETCLAISPAALEMAGILVVAEPEHFDRVDEQTVQSIYEEVSLDPGRFAQLAEALR